MISLGSRHCVLRTRSEFSQKMWCHNYVIDRNEYIIFTLSESVNPWVYSLQFLFKSTNNSWRYERKCEWVFFFWTQCSIVPLKSQIKQSWKLIRQTFSKVPAMQRSIDWLIEQGLTSPPTQYRLYGRRFFTGQKTQPTVSNYWRHT